MVFDDFGQKSSSLRLLQPWKSSKTIGKTAFFGTSGCWCVRFCCHVVVLVFDQLDLSKCAFRVRRCAIFWWTAPRQESSKWASKWTFQEQFWSLNLFIIFKKHRFSLGFLHFLQHHCYPIFNKIVKMTAPCKMKLALQKVAKIAIFLLFFDDFWSHKETVGDHRGTGRGPHQNGLVEASTDMGPKKAILVWSPTGPPVVPHRSLGHLGPFLEPF